MNETQKDFLKLVSVLLVERQSNSNFLLFWRNWKNKIEKDAFDALYKHLLEMENK